MAELTERGYPVAVPLVDDDGVDLVVNYNLAVQVKCSSKSSNGHYQFSAGWTEKTGPLRIRRHEHVDLFALCGLDDNIWWLAPASLIDRADTTISLGTTSKGWGKYSHLHAWRDAWYAFEFSPSELENLAGEAARQKILHQHCYCESCKRAEREEIFLKLLTPEEEAC